MVKTATVSFKSMVWTVYLFFILISVVWTVYLFFISVAWTVFYFDIYGLDNLLIFLKSMDLWSEQPIYFLYLWSGQYLFLISMVWTVFFGTNSLQITFFCLLRYSFLIISLLCVIS